MDLYQVNKKVFSYLSQRKTMYFGDIYHYTSPLGLKGIIEDSVVWFSDMRFLNDASEIIYIYKIAYETIHKMEINNDLKNMVEAICYSLHNTGCYLDDNKEIIPIDNYYLASFSKDHDN